MISLLMPTLRREKLIGRAIRSLIAQTHEDWELVIVDGFSNDGSREAVAAFGDRRLRFFEQPGNVLAAKNFAFDVANGDWLAVFDSDDELVPHALSTLFRPLAEVATDLDAVSCNCVNARDGKFTGLGLNGNQFLTVPTVLERARGEHWGMFHRRILGDRRFNPNLFGQESVLWNQIHEYARWYYIDQGLRIYHCEGDDRLSSKGTLRDRHKRDYVQYAAMFDDEVVYLEKLRGWSLRAFQRVNFKAGGQFMFAEDHPRFLKAYANLIGSGATARALALRAGMAASPVVRRSRDLVSALDHAGESLRSRIRGA